jgi:hypothetical protein
VARDHIQILITNSNYPPQAQIEKDLPSLVCDGGGGVMVVGARRRRWPAAWGAIDVVRARWR